MCVRCQFASVWFIGRNCSATQKHKQVRTSTLTTSQSLSDFIPTPAFVLQTEAAQKERVESMWKAEQERRAKAGEDFQTDQKSRAAVEKASGCESCC